MKLKVVSVALMVSLLSSCVSKDPEMYSLAPGGPRAVSMVGLLVEPEKYKNVHIEVHGYLGKFPNLSLFLTQDSYEIMDYMSSVHVTNLSFKETAISEYCGDKYAIVQGDLLLGDKDSPFNGTYYIGNLARILVFSEDELEQCWPEES